MTLFRQRSSPSHDKAIYNMQVIVKPHKIAPRCLQLKSVDTELVYVSDIRPQW